jgi:hypothetical protein
MSIGPPGGPPDPWYRGYWGWGYYNRPYSGCSCLWVILVIVIVWWLIAWFWYPSARFGLW